MLPEFVRRGSAAMSRLSSVFDGRPPESVPAFGPLRRECLSCGCGLLTALECLLAAGETPDADLEQVASFYLLTEAQFERLHRACVESGLALSVWMQFRLALGPQPATVGRRPQ